MYKQIIIARKDLNMSHGKLAAQVSHGSMAFLTWAIRNNSSKWLSSDDSTYYSSELIFDKDLYEQWINGAFTKCVLQAKNKNQLLKAKMIAEEMGMVEGKDFFLIKDNCRTELEPEEVDENGIGRTLTCIGFAPMDSEIIDKISKKYQLYK
jgi:PTH2 family peptidyl-tRNA hydrolase